MNVENDCSLLNGCAPSVCTVFGARLHALPRHLLHWCFGVAIKLVYDPVLRHVQFISVKAQSMDMNAQLKAVYV